MKYPNIFLTNKSNFPLTNNTEPKRKAWEKNLENIPLSTLVAQMNLEFKSNRRSLLPSFLPASIYKYIYTYRRKHKHKRTHIGANSCKVGGARANIYQETRECGGFSSFPEDSFPFRGREGSRWWMAAGARRRGGEGAGRARRFFGTRIRGARGSGGPSRTIEGPWKDQRSRTRCWSPGAWLGVSVRCADWSAGRVDLRFTMLVCAEWHAASFQRRFQPLLLLCSASSVIRN